MDETFLAEQRSLVAKRVGAPEENPEPHHVSYEERVTPQPKANYIPPSFFKKTASVEQYQELVSILEELWSLNELFAGERTREAEIYLHWSGQTKAINERIMNWCGSYGQRRLEKYDPRDDDNKYRQFHRITDEFGHISDQLNGLGSLDYLFSQTYTSFSEWFVFQGSFRKYLEFEYVGNNIQMLIGGIDGYCRHCIDLMIEKNFHRDVLWEFLQFLGKTSCFDGRFEFIAEQAIALNDIASDLLEMRPYFIEETREAMLAFEFRPNVWLAWTWTGSVNLGYLTGGSTEDEARNSANRGMARYTVQIDDDGRIVDGSKPWLRMEGDGLETNLQVVNRLHGIIWQSYEKINFDALRGRFQDPTFQEASPTEFEQLFSLSCQDLAARTTPSVERPHKNRHIGQLRKNELLSFLTSFFGCESRQGKGSEVNIYRPGSRMFTLGSHGKNPEVPSVVVRRLLRRLEIPEKDWLREVYA